MTSFSYIATFNGIVNLLKIRASALEPLNRLRRYKYWFQIVRKPTNCEDIDEKRFAIP